MELPRGGSVVSVNSHSPDKMDYAPTVINVQSGETWPNQPGTVPDINDVTMRMKQMEADMQRMQQQMAQQFKNFPMMAPPMIAEGIPQGIPQGMPQGMPPAPFMPIDMGRPLTPTMGGRPLTPTMDTMGRPLTPNMMNMPQNLPMDPMAGTLTGRGPKKHLKLQLDMGEFQPDEIQVKHDKNKLEVHAQHEEKAPDRVACRVFRQSYQLPPDHKLTKLQSHVTPEGKLALEGNVKPQYRVKFAEDVGTPPK